MKIARKKSLILEALVAAKKLSEKTGDSLYYNQQKIQLEEAVQNCLKWREKLVDNIEESCGELTVNKMPVIFSFIVQTGFIFLRAKITSTKHLIFLLMMAQLLGIAGILYLLVEISVAYFRDANVKSIGLQQILSYCKYRWDIFLGKFVLYVGYLLISFLFLYLTYKLWIEPKSKIDQKQKKVEKIHRENEHDDSIDSWWSE